MPKISVTFAALIIGLGLAPIAVASPICDDLGRQLANLSETIGSTAKARKYARAIAEQKQGIRELRIRVRESGCSTDSVFVVDGGDDPALCDQFAEKLTRMSNNLAILTEKRARIMAGETSGVERARLMNAIEENGCNAEPILASAPADQGQAENLPNGVEVIRVPTSEPDYANSQFVDLGGTSSNGSFRTLCVRACDGAYFPISSHASTLDFRRDAQVCSMMCPGNRTELYYHGLTEESADMRSTETGRRYDDLDTAYRFRTRKPGDAECSCNFALYYKEMMRREAFIRDPEAAKPKDSSITWVKPELRGGIKDQPKSQPVEHAERDYQPGEKIRVVGPQFLPQENRIDFGKPLPSD